MKTIRRSLSLLLAMLLVMTMASAGFTVTAAGSGQLTVTSAESSPTAAASLGPENLIDGSIATFWSSIPYVTEVPATPGYFDLALSAKSEVREIRLMPRTANIAGELTTLCFPTEFKFQYSLDGSGWADIPGASYSDYQSTAAWQVFALPQPVTADRIRIIATRYTADDSGTNHYFQLAEAQVYGDEAAPPPASDILTIVDTASSPTAASSFPPSNLVDGDVNNFWSSTPSAVEAASSPGYFDLTFDQAATVTEFRLMPRVFSGQVFCFPKQFKFQYSLDGSGWADIPGASYSDYQSTPAWQSFVLPTPVKADKIRMTATRYGTDDNGNYYFQLAEAQVLGYTDSVVEPTKAFGEKYEVADASSSNGLTERELDGETVHTGSENARIAFPGVDFGDGQALSVEMAATGWFNASICNIWWEDAVLDVYLDNTAGSPIAKIYLDYEDETIPNTELKVFSGSLNKTVFGVHNVIVCFRGSTAAFQWLRLSTGEASPNAIELREAEYLANQPDMSRLVDLQSDTWGGTDLLGRKIETNETGESTYQEDKIVGMFMWDWHFKTNKVYNVEEILAANPNDPQFGPIGEDYYWGEPVYGYYTSLDKWVIRQQGELLADAGVDVLFFDCTNGDMTFKSAYLQFFKVYNDILKSGAKMPKLSFMLPFATGENTNRDLISLYENIYEKGLYQESWFYWNGKPLILNGPAADTPSYIQDFFSFKMITSTYVNSVQNPTNAWAWLEVYPQNQYVDRDGSSFMTVGVAQNHNGERLAAMNAGDNVLGRTMTRNEDGTFTRHTEDGALLQGYNFQQQFDRAIDTDTDFVFITGWNEWMATRFASWEGTQNAHPDQYSPEYSRDLEPSKGVLKDVYYCQLVENIRKFKGARPVPTAEECLTMSMDGDFSDWTDANTYYTYSDNIQDRDCAGRDGHYYVNTSGRNDLTLAKAAIDSKYAYFYVQTKDAIQGMDEGSFMQLFLNTDRDASTGWEGYDFLLNRTSPTADTMTLERCTGDFTWETAAEISYVINGNEMELAIPLNVLGISAKETNLEFKWMDHVLNMENPDIMDIYTQGDAAPGSRFNYILKADENLVVSSDLIVRVLADVEDTEITSVTAKTPFRVQISGKGLTGIRLQNEYGLNMGKLGDTVETNEEGITTITITTRIDTVGSGRTLKVLTQESSGYADSGLRIVIDVTAPKPMIESVSAPESAKVNTPFEIQIITGTDVSRIRLYNEYGASLSVNSSYADVDGKRIWIVSTRVGTYGSRVLSVYAVNRYGVSSDPVQTTPVAMRFI